MRRPFRRGDQIETNECEGIVEDVNFRVVVLRTFDGERVLVPCAEVLSKPITNHTALGRRRTTLEVGVGYDADLELAREVLLAAAQGADGVLERPPAEVWVKEFGDSSVTLAVRFWHAPDMASKWRARSLRAPAVMPISREMEADMLARWMRRVAVAAPGLFLIVNDASAHHVMGGKTPATFAEGVLSGLGHPIIGPDHRADPGNPRPLAHQTAPVLPGLWRRQAS